MARTSAPFFRKQVVNSQDVSEKLALLYQVRDPTQIFNVMSDASIYHWPIMANQYSGANISYSNLSYSTSGNKVSSAKALQLNGISHYVMLCKDIQTSVTGSVGYTIDMNLSCANQNVKHQIGPGTTQGYKTTIFHLKGDIALDTIGDTELYFETTDNVTYICYAVYNSAPFVRKWKITANSTISNSASTADTHLALVVDSNNGPRLFINGVLQTVTTPGVNYGGVWHCNSGSFCCLTIGGHYWWTPTTYEDRIACLFKGCIQNFRIRGGLIWTANFTPPTTAFSDTSSPDANDYVLIPFNGTLRDLVSGKLMAASVQANSTSTYAAGNGKYSIQVGQGGRHGLYVNSAGSFYNVNMTIEILCYLFTDSGDHAVTNDQYLFYMGAVGSSTDGGEVSIKRRHCTTANKTTMIFTCGNREITYNMNDMNRICSFKLCFADNSKMYCYINNTYAGCNEQTILTQGTGNFYIGFKPGIWNSGFNGYISEVKVLTGVAKYQWKGSSAGKTLPNNDNNYTYESHLLCCVGKDGDTYAVDLHPKYGDALASVEGSGVKVKVQATNGSLYDYWAPTRVQSSSSSDSLKGDILLRNKNNKECRLVPYVIIK